MTESFMNSLKNFRLSKEVCKKILIAVSACILYGVYSGFSKIISSVIKAAIYSAGTLSYTEIQTAFTIGTFVVAFASPVMGIIAMKRSNILVMLCGLVMLVLGNLCLAFTTSSVGLFLGVGILNAVGQSAFAFGLIFGMVSPLFTEKTAMIVSSLLTISSSAFNIFVSPLTQYIELTAGLSETLLIYCGILVLIFPLCLLFAGKKTPGRKKNETKKIDFKSGVKTLLKSRVFQMIAVMELIIGLTTGISNHSYVAMIDSGIEEMQVAFINSGMQLVAMISTLLAVAFVLRVKKKFLFGSLLFGLLALTELGIYFCHMDFTFLVPLLFIGTLIKKFPNTLMNLSIRTYFSPIIVGTLMTIVSLFSKIGSGINSIAGAIVFEYFHSFDIIYLFDGIIGVAGCILVCIFAVKYENKLKPYEEQKSEELNT